YKTIFFIDSATKAYELHKKYENYSMFNCSKSHRLYKHVNEDKLNNLLQDEKFDDLILFTTTAMDTGVNIIDSKLNNIVCDVKDVRTLQQCIGRKRLQNKDDYIHLVVKSINNQQLGGSLARLNKKMEMADYLRANDTKSLISNYPRQSDAGKIIYDKWENGEMVKEVNELAYFKCVTDRYDINQMLKLG